MIKEPPHNKLRLNTRLSKNLLQLAAFVSLLFGETHSKIKNRIRNKAPLRRKFMECINRQYEDAKCKKAQRDNGQCLPD